MVIFLNDDSAYLSWIRRHHSGYVLDGHRSGHGRVCWLHRACCPDIKTGPRRQWTTGAKLKACSLDSQELKTWTTEEALVLRACQACLPDNDQCSSNPKSARVTKLGRDVLSYVLEAALIHMEHECAAYRVTEQDIANCLHKTPAQLSQVFQQLTSEGLLTTSAHIGDKATRLREPLVLPTISALRTLPAFQADSDATILTELAKLNSQ